MVEVLQVTHLIKALGQRRRVSGQDAYFINVSLWGMLSHHLWLKLGQSAATSMYSAEGGWPYGQVKDTDPIYELEKEIGRENPVRAVSHIILIDNQAWWYENILSNLPPPPD